MIATHPSKKYVLGILTLSLMSSMLCAINPNTVTGEVDETVISFSDPEQIVFTPDGTKAYIINGEGVTVIDVDTNATIHDVDDTYETFDHASCLAISLDGTTLYAGNYYYASVLIIDTSTDIMTGAVTDGGSDIDYPISLSMTSDGATLYCLNGGGSYDIVIIDVATNTVSGIIPGSIDFSDPLQIVVSPDNSKAYVVDDSAFGLGAIFIVDLGSNIITGIVTDSGSAFDVPYALVFSPDGLLAFVANNEGNAPSNTGSVVVIDVAADIVINDIISDDFRYPQSIAILPSGLLVYMTDNQSGISTQGSVWIIDPVTQEVVGTINDTSFPFNGPVNMGISPDGQTMYVSNTDNNFVSIVFTIIPILPPTDLTGEMLENNFLTQIDLVNKLTWQAPASGTAPAVYKIYQDSGLLKLIGTVSADVLEFLDHNQQYGTTSNYYIISQDANGNASTAAHVAVATSARPNSLRR